MKIEDYNEYYIQGSDHYLIPKDVFDELFDEMVNWREENKILKQNAENNNKVVDKITYTIKPSFTTRKLKQLQKENKQLKENWNKLKEDLIKIRKLTFTKYNKNEWENCLSFNDDILPLIEKMKELEGNGGK